VVHRRRGVVRVCRRENTSLIKRGQGKRAASQLPECVAEALFLAPPDSSVEKEEEKFVPAQDVLIKSPALRPTP